MKIKSIPLEQIEEEADVDLVLTEDKTSENSMDTPTIHNKYLRHFRVVSNELTAMNLEMDRLWLERWKYYSGKAHPDKYEEHPLDHKIMKSDVKMYISGDEKVIKLRFQIGLLETKLKVITKILEDISRRSFHIRNAIATIKFKHGEN